MVDDNDARLSGLYRQSSREEPPARLDRAVMELAGKSVRRRTLAPFGNHWVAAGALAGICLVSVLLVVLLPKQAGVPDLPQSLRDADAPQAEQSAKMRYPAPDEDEIADRMQGNAGGGLEQRDTGRQHFDFYSVMPEAEREVTAGERVQPSTAVPAPERAVPAAGYFLEIGGFGDLVQAEAMQDKLAFMRLDARIQKGDGTQTGYLIRVGPYTDLNELDRVQALLDKRGIKTTRERVP